MGTRFSRKTPGTPFVEWRFTDWHGDDPLAGGLCLHQLFDPLQNIVDAIAANEGRQCFLEPFAIHVRVSIDEAGDHETTSRIDALRCGSTNHFYIGIGTRREDQSVFDRDRFYDAIVQIEVASLPPVMARSARPLGCDELIDLDRYQVASESRP